MRLAAVSLVVVAASLASPPAAEAAIDFCAPAERSCSRLVVPLDRSGEVPGRVGLQVERSRARRPIRPPLVLIAGGPGQSSTRAFSEDANRSLLGAERRARDVIVMDARGTGDSDALSCPRLQRGETLVSGRVAAGCAARLGPARAFYTAREAADDIEAVRREIEAPKIALFGSSYGTKVALTYAARYPERVDRLLLDSVLEGDASPDPLYRPSLRAASRVLRAVCRNGACRDFTRDPVRDIARLAARLQARPLRGKLFDGRGRSRMASLDGFGLLNVLLAGDFDDSLRAVLPGVVRSALRGDPVPALRTAAQASRSQARAEPPRFFSVAAFASAVCEESPLPWDRAASPGERREQAASLVRSSPRDAFGPLGPGVALESDILELCSRWPSGPAPAPLGPLPDVPALLLAGDSDLRTPVENARAVAARLPQARVLVAPNTGHDVSGTSFSRCVQLATKRFLAGRQPARSCPSASLPLEVVPPPPISLADVRPASGTRGRSGRTLRSVQLTIDDTFTQVGSELVELIVELFEEFGVPGGRSEPLRFGGLRGGYSAYQLSRDRLLLRDASFVPGVRVTGRVDGLFSDREGGARGRLVVRGRTAARGALSVRGTVISGRLGGRRVRLRAGPATNRVAERVAAAVRSRSRRDE